MPRNRNVVVIGSFSETISETTQSTSLLHMHSHYLGSQSPPPSRGSTTFSLSGIVGNNRRYKFNRTRTYRVFVLFHELIIAAQRGEKYDSCYAFKEMNPLLTLIFLPSDVYHSKSKTNRHWQALLQAYPYFPREHPKAGMFWHVTWVTRAHLTKKFPPHSLQRDAMTASKDCDR